MRKGRRTIIDLSGQSGLDFDDENYEAEFTKPGYQQRLLLPRAYALITDLAIVFVLYVVFVFATMSEMAGPIQVNRTVIGIYAVAYLILIVAYLGLFMLSTSQTTGMKMQRLIVVNRRGRPLGPQEALLRTFGYLISAVPVMFGFLWAIIDPEHLTWTDKVSHTFIKRV
jgi:uncharacterized RDD family membrane protein YckC